MRKRRYLILTIIYLLGFIFHIWLFYTKGWASLFSTFFLYSSLCLIALGILRLMHPKKISPAYFSNLKLLIISLLLFMFLGELTLRYVLKIGLSYKEENGSFFYVSPFVYNQRILNKYRYLIHPPNSKQQITKSEFSYLHQFNSMGLREREISSMLLDSQAIQILGLGDSYTEGTGTQQDSTWLRILENQLNVQASDQQVFTINAGNAGSDPVYDYIKLKEKLLPIQPDLVILSINYSDVIDLNIRGGFERYQDKYILNQQPWWEPFFASSLIFRGIAHIAFGYNMDLIKPSEKQKRIQEAKENIIKAIDLFKKLSTDHSFKLLLIIHPLQEEVLDQEFHLDFIYQHYKNQPDIYTLNLLEAFLKTGGMTANNIYTYYWKYDGHHTTKGYALWAELLKNYIIENEILQDLTPRDSL